MLSVATDFASIPNYLKAVTILRPEGNLPAEVCAAVNYLASGTNPKETVAAQVGLIKDTAALTRQLQQKQALEEIDKKWEKEKESLGKESLFMTGNKKKVPPSRGRAVLKGLGCGIVSMVFGISLLFPLGRGSGR